AQVRRFEQEAKLIAALEHPHIVPIIDIRMSRQGQLCYVMRYLPNGDLSRRVLPLSPDLVRKLLKALLHALGTAHAKGIVHRDVKPENVLFDELNRPRLSDFGIAISGEVHSRLTKHGETIGSTPYMSPEQARGVALDARSDLYSVGVVAFELLTGRRPYVGADVEVLLKHQLDPIPVLPMTLSAWQRFIERAMAKRAEERYASAAEMIAAIPAVDALPMSEVVTGALPVVDAGTLAASTGSAAAAAGSPIPDPEPEPAALAAAPEPEAESSTPAADSDAPTRAREVLSLPVAAPTRVAPGRRRLITPMLLGSVLVVLLGVWWWRWLAAPAEVALPTAAAEAEPISPAIPVALEQAISAGHWFEPVEANAYAELLKLREATADDLSLIEPYAEARRRFFAGLRAAVAAASIEVAEPLARRALSAAGALNERAHPEVVGLSADLAARLQSELDRVLAEGDRATASSALALARELPAVDPAFREKAERAAALPSSRETRQDRGGPALAWIPPGKRQAFPNGMLVMLAEVDAASYAAYARATRKPLGRCPREQRTAQAAVCINYTDAEGYATWLSKQTGQRYRLPTLAEWRALPGASELLSGLGGPIQEWTASCEMREMGAVREALSGLGRALTGKEGPAPKKHCAGHHAAGLQDGRVQSAVRAKSAARPDLGFRLLREP
ncbi:MAG: bifunctional serine/threonine-protein kinase/formylglycine-generating enzyme family protein, partial [Xanthomonadales bacterium]|nr:bifunctional serine/threonine-protein kinase/formylglycine-generating enzyme family protein [Xanthomonadales bacterium]